MFISKKSFFTINVASLLIYSSLSSAATIEPRSTTNNKSFLYMSFLYIQPNADNLKYATFVSGTQPYHQSWHYLAINPNFHGAFELGYNYALADTPYSTAVYWTHLNSNDSSSKQASTNTDLSTIEFVGPPFEMSPPVFGIKRVDSTANFAFDNVLLNMGKLVEYSSHLSTRFFGGLTLLNLNETVTTTFSDYAGSPATAYSYATPPDPSFSFQLQNVSKYLGAGPDVGMSVEYKTESGFGIMGQILGLLTVGLIQAQDNFTSTSARLTDIGIGTSHQEITSPNTTQVVFGADGQIGAFYNYDGIHLANMTIEAGYRLATYINAISTVNPQTLVQPGTVTSTPEFATGTMAIVSTDNRSRTFSFNGPFLDIKIDIT